MAHGRHEVTAKQYCIPICCPCVSHSVMSDSLQPHGLQPPRLLCPWNFPGKNTGMGCHSLLQGIFPTQELNSGLLNFAGRFFNIPIQKILTRQGTSSFSSIVQSSNHVRLFETPWTAACQASPSLTISQSLPTFMFIASVMPPSHLILCPNLSQHQELFQQVICHIR